MPLYMAIWPEVIIQLRISIRHAYLISVDGVMKILGLG